MCWFSVNWRAGVPISEYNAILCKPVWNDTPTQWRVVELKTGPKRRTACFFEIHFAYHAQGRCVRGTRQTGAGIGTCSGPGVPSVGLTFGLVVEMFGEVGHDLIVHGDIQVAVGEFGICGSGDIGHGRVEGRRNLVHAGELLAESVR